MSSNSAFTVATEHFTYIGHGKVPKNVTRVIIHQSVTAIPEFAFEYCYDLWEVVFPEGLLEIREWAFRYCTSLKELNFPSTLQEIGGCAFIECRSIQHLKIPSRVITIGDDAFKECSALKDVQLREGLKTIESSAFSNCYSLLRINIPSSVTTIGNLAFDDCNLLRNVSIVPDSTLGQTELGESFLLHNLHRQGCSLKLLKGRFDYLPLHRICFYQTKSATFLEEANEHATKERLATVDCLRMTPLHILVCSGRHDVGLYKLFVRRYPEALLIEDKWGVTPIVSAILSDAPQQTIHFLFEKHSKLLNRSLPFNFSPMVEMLAKKDGTSPEFMQSIIQAQRTHFPNLEIEWERIVNDNVEGEMHVKMFGVLAEASVSNFNQMSSGHRKEMDNLINDVSKVHQERQREGRDQVRDLIAASVQQFVEVTTMIELALWQVTIDELKTDQESNKEGGPCQKRAKIDNTDDLSPREESRVSCKAGVIIPLVLSFLW